MTQQQLSPQDWQLLSAYLDGQLSERDRETLEARLKTRADLSSALEDIQKTRAMLRSVRKQRVPRNFTLTPAMVQKARPNPLLRLVPVLNFASAAAALAVVVILAVGLLPGRLSAPALAPAAAPLETSSQPAELYSDQPKMILQWSNQGGYGGGGDEPVYDAKSAGSAPLGMGGGGGSGSTGFTLPPDVVDNMTDANGAQSAQSLQQTAPSGEPAQPMATLAPAAPFDTAGPTAEAPAPASIAAAPQNLPPLSGSGPILGAQPASEAEASNRQVMANAPAPSADTSVATPAPVGRGATLAAAILAAIAVLSGLAAFLIHRFARS